MLLLVLLLLLRPAGIMSANVSTSMMKAFLLLLIIPYVAYSGTTALQLCHDCSQASQAS